MTKTLPEHHKGVIILKHRKRPVAVSLDASRFMSLPQSVRKHYEKEWKLIRVCADRKKGGSDCDTEGKDKPI